MAELSEWSAQVLRYQGSDGPVKVMYFRSRLAVTNNSFDQNSAGPNERPESVGEQVSFKASGAPDTRAILSGHLFDNPVEVLDSKNYKLQGDEWFKDTESALEDLASEFNNSPKVVPFDKDSSYGLEFLYIEPTLIKRSEKDDLLWSSFKHYPPHAKDNEVIQANRQREGRRGRKKEGRGGGKKGGEGEGRQEERKKEEEKKIQDNKVNKKEMEEKKKKQILKKRKELDGMILRDRRQGFRCQCALIFGITTKFNPSGMWIVEDIFYDEEGE